MVLALCWPTQELRTQARLKCTHFDRYLTRVSLLDDFRVRTTYLVGIDLVGIVCTVSDLFHCSSQQSKELHGQQPAARGRKERRLE